MHSMIKKIQILIILLIISFVGKSQFINNTTSGSPTTLLNSRGGYIADSALILSKQIFSDTTAANLSVVSKYSGALIQVTGGQIWYRTLTPAKWWLINSSAASLVSISQAYGVIATPNPITNTGTIGADTSFGYLATNAIVKKKIDSVIGLIYSNQVFTQTGTTIKSVTNGATISATGAIRSAIVVSAPFVNADTVSSRIIDNSQLLTTNTLSVTGNATIGTNLSVSNSVTAAAHITAGGTIAQYVDGTGALHTFPSIISPTDTSAMLSSYLRKSDTATMLAPFVQYSDTVNMLSNLLRKTDTATMLLPYLHKSDTSFMLSNLLRKTDTLSMLSGYARTGNLSVQYWKDSSNYLAPNTGYGGRNILTTGNITGGALTMTNAGSFGGNLIATGNIVGSSGLGLNVTRVSSTYSVLSTDYYIECTSGTFTVTLPNPTTGGRIYVVKNSGTGVITINATGPSNIDNSSSQTLSDRYSSYVFQSNSASGQWNIISNYPTASVGGGGITLTGTANQINVSAPNGNSTVSLSTGIILPGTLSTTGNISAGGITTTGSVSVGGMLTVTGNEIVGGNLTVTGAITTGSLSTNGAITVNNAAVNINPTGGSIAMVISGTQGASILQKRGSISDEAGTYLYTGSEYNWFTGFATIGIGSNKDYSIYNNGTTQRELIINYTTGNITMSHGLTVTGSLSATLSTAAQPNITSLGSLTNLTVSGNISAGSLTITNSVTINGVVSAQGERFNVTASNLPVLFKTTGGAANAWTANFWNNDVSGNNLFVEFGTEGTYTGRGSITYNRAGGLTVFGTTSDRRAKKIIGKVNSGALIDSLKVYMGLMNGATMARPMFIADELSSVAPYAVTGDKDAIDKKTGLPIYQQVDVSALVPLVVSEVQDLRKRLSIKDAENKILIDKIALQQSEIYKIKELLIKNKIQ